MNEPAASEAARSLEQRLDVEQAADRFEADWVAYCDGKIPRPPRAEEHLGDLSAAGQALVGRLLQVQAEYAARRPRTGPPQPGSLAPLLPPGYRLLGKLGEGGMGVVYGVVHVETKRREALKMIRPGRLTDEARARFQLEVEAGCRLSHPNIVSVYRVGEHNGEPFFSMTLIEEGTSLVACAGGKALPPREAAGILEKLARAVQHAHDRGVIHRDIKPGNVLVDRQGEPHLTDFSLAKFTRADRALTATNAILGTPLYMAPEQTDVNQVPTTAVDVYGLGAVLYELLTGRPPFCGEDPVAILYQVRNAEPAGPRSLSPAVDRGLETICLKCLEKEPKKRYASAQDLADDLRRYLNGDVPKAQPMGRAERVWRHCRKHPSQAIAVACGVAALLLLFLLGVNFAYQDELQEKERIAQDKAREASAYRLIAIEEAEQTRSALWEAAGLNCDFDLKSGMDFFKEGEVSKGLAHSARALKLAMRIKDRAREDRCRAQIGVMRTYREWKDPAKRAANPDAYRRAYKVTVCLNEDDPDLQGTSSTLFPRGLWDAIDKAGVVEPEKEKISQFLASVVPSRLSPWAGSAEDIQRHEEEEYGTTLPPSEVEAKLDAALVLHRATNAGGRVNYLFLDGSVRSVSPGMLPGADTYLPLATRADGEALPGDW
jgi:prepilin-type processing-associated H-X9-DG protein